VKPVRGICKSLHLYFIQRPNEKLRFNDQHVRASKPAQVIAIRARIFLKIIVKRKDGRVTISVSA
jgi:hypothetical protein